MKIIVITGPTAIGKTTLAWITARRFKKHGVNSIVLSIRPFCGLSFILLYLLSTIYLFLYPEYDRVSRVRYRFAFIESVKPLLLHRLISLLVFLDDVSLTLYLLVIKLLNKIRCNLFILEDFIPQSIADHAVFIASHRGIDRAIDHATREILFFKRMMSSEFTCIHRSAPVHARIVRITRRGDLPVKVIGLYEEYVRDSLVLTISKILCDRVVVIGK